MLSSTGHAAAYAIKVTFIRSPGPRSRATSGMSTTAGIGRRNSTRAHVALRTPGTLPRIRPHGTATATAVASPAAHASSVAARSVRNRGLAARPAARASTVEASGSTDRLNTPEPPSS